MILERLLKKSLENPVLVEKYIKFVEIYEKVKEKGIQVDFNLYQLVCWFERVQILREEADGSLVEHHTYCYGCPKKKHRNIQKCFEIDNNYRN
ncbi:hypothetical protein [Deferribacter abyssi]|uniref:hypothetical protein n=1 Tax=Deferribacter abyssi TaxID=213806 RepID=UPI003C1DFD11